MARRGRVAAAVLLAGLAGPPSAAALVGSTDGVAGLDGSIRTFAAGTDNFDFAPFFGGDAADARSATLLRLTLLGRPRPWLAYEVHGVQSVDYTSAVAASGAVTFELFGRDVRYRALDATTDWRERDDLLASLFVDRANVRVAMPFGDATLGRQAITFGKTFFWNPLDVFLAFDPRQFDQDYKPGVDAVRLDVPLGPFSGVNVVAAAGRTVTALGTYAGGDDALHATWFGSAVMGRAFATVGGFDLALQGGKIYGGEHVGAGATGELGPLEVRLEAMQLFADDSPPLLPGVFPPDERLVEDAFLGVVGVGHRFESSLTLEAEYFMNGAGDDADLEAAFLRFANGGAFDLTEHLMGAAVSYDILPILVGRVIGIVAADDPSFLIQPLLTWSAADEVEVLAGATTYLGERPNEPLPGLVVLESEFGTFPDVYFVEVKFYF